MPRPTTAGPAATPGGAAPPVSGGGFFGLDARYAIPLDSSTDISDITTRTWSFRLMYVKGVGVN